MPSARSSVTRYTFTNLHDVTSYKTATFIGLCVMLSASQSVWSVIGHLMNENDSETSWNWWWLKTLLHWSSLAFVVDESSKVNLIDEPNSIYILHRH